MSRLLSLTLFAGKPVSGIQVTARKTPEVQQQPVAVSMADVDCLSRILGAEGALENGR